MTKKAGRPKIGANNTKGVFFAARFTPGESQRLHAAIARSKLSKSQWMRKTLLSAADNDKR